MKTKAQLSHPDDALAVLSITTFNLAPNRGDGAGRVKLQTSDTSLGVFDKLTLTYTECQTQLVKYTK